MANLHYSPGEILLKILHQRNVVSFNCIKRTPYQALGRTLSLFCHVENTQLLYGAYLHNTPLVHATHQEERVRRPAEVLNLVHTCVKVQYL